MEPTITGLRLERNNRLIDFGGRIVTAANGAYCTSTVHWNESLADCSTGQCKFTEVYKMKSSTIVRNGERFSLVDAQMEHVKDSEVPEDLKAKQFQVLNLASINGKIEYQQKA